jgi:hypothetical protein
MSSVRGDGQVRTRSCENASWERLCNTSSKTCRHGCGLKVENPPAPGTR